MMKISVIMASYLGDYPNAASNRDQKFKRAVRSFINQPYNNKELIVVSDGCEKTCEYISEMTQDLKQRANDITLIRLDKQELFSGQVRNKGIEVASGDIISYLDTDDILFGNHLGGIVAGMTSGFDWVYFNDFVAMSADFTQKRQRDNIISQGRVGTSSIAHRRNLDVKWDDGYEHDWRMIQQLKDKFSKYAKIIPKGYMVCHIPGQCDF